MSDRNLAARRLLAVTEEELQRVVLDMHDGPVQNLFAALGQLSMLHDRIAARDASAALLAPLERAELLLESSLHEIRQIVGTLHSPEFSARGLAEIIEAQVVQHETLTSADVELVVRGPVPPVSLLVKIACYRVLQEALSNIRRHAGANGATVRLYSDDRSVWIEIEDRGRGFEPPPLVGPNATERQQHVGLRGMRERAAMVGGELTVSSRVGAGTCVRIRVPRDDRPDGSDG